MTMDVTSFEAATAPPNPRRRWRGRSRPDVVPAGDWPDIIGRILAMRGIVDIAGARAFVAAPGPQPDPYVLPNLDVAIERLSRAVRDGESVAVFGDFDVDGITSVAQLTQALTALGARAIPYIPDRFREGYGLTVEAIRTLRAQGATLLVTADCGTSSVHEVAEARAAGMDVIILDHHTVPPELPDATALVNPKLPDARPGGLLELATAGLAFHVVAALYDACQRPFEADAYLDLAALGTVCDMAPLTDENRRLLRDGLRALAGTTRRGLRALLVVSGVDAKRVGAEEIGFRLGPRINAAGRMAHANIALELLVTDDEDRAMELAARLDALNRDRQQKTSEAVALAAGMLDGAAAEPLIMIGDRDFSSGIVGIIASKLVDLYGRPAVVYEHGATESRASCRSIEQFHITDALRLCPELFVRFGGHRQAAGFTADNVRLEEIRERLVRSADEVLRGVDLTPLLNIDCNVPLRALRGAEIAWLARLAPFGIGNPEPAFLARNVTVLEARVIGDGDKHLKLKVRDGSTTWPAIAFEMGDLIVDPGDHVDIVYTPVTGGYDDTVEIHVRDLRPSRANDAQA